MRLTGNSALYRSGDGYQRVLDHYDRTLGKLDITWGSVFVETGFGATHLVQCGHGQGKPVILWHGLNANATTWVGWLPALVGDYRVYAVDTIGGLGKSAASRPDSRGPAYGLWAEQVVDALGLERANMIGASNGAWLILKLASVAPDRIGSAVLMSTAGLARLSLFTTLRMVPRVLGKPPAEAARGLLELLSPPGLAPDPFFLEFFELILSSGFRSEPMAPRLADSEILRLDAPTYLLMSEFERSFNPYRAMQRGLRLLPRIVTAEIVPGVGHSLAHADPDWVPRRVRCFLREHAVG